jgi:hypothetical protein
MWEMQHFNIHLLICKYVSRNVNGDTREQRTRVEGSRFAINSPWNGITNA